MQSDQFSDSGKSMRSMIHAQRPFIAALLMAIAGASVSSPADAQSVYGRKRAPVFKTAAVSKADTVRPGPVTLAGGSLKSQTVTLFDGTTKVAQAPISSGTSSNPTPTGVFSVIGKERYHESNLYSNAPMPFMQRLTWDGIAMHGGHLPGYPASHGCIRLPHVFAKALFGVTQMEQEVVVLKDISTPVKRPEPKPLPVVEPPVVPVAPPAVDPAVIPPASPPKPF